MNENQNGKSYFDGGYFAYIGYSLLVGFVSVVSFGIALPWMLCLFQRWKCKHTVICGKRMCFNGTGISLIGHYLLWCLLSIITFGIYSLWLTININKWLAKHTHFQGEEDNNSYFDGGVLGLLGTNILSFIVLFVPLVGFAWSTIIKTKWLKSHTVCDSRRLIFEGGVGGLFVKYLLWGFLSIITFGIFAWFVPVKEMRWLTERTIDNENTTEALMKQSEFRTNLHTDAATFKTYRVEDEMECVKSGITDAMSESDLLALANAANRAAQYEYVLRYANGNYTEEPFASFLKSSAELGFGPAMNLYIQNFELKEDNANMVTEAAKRGHTFAIKQEMKCFATNGLEADEKKFLGLDDLVAAVRYSMLLQEDGVTLDENETALIKECIFKIRRILSAQKRNKTNVAAIVICAVVVPLILALLISVFALFMKVVPARPSIDFGPGMATHEDFEENREYDENNVFSYVDDTVISANF